MVGLFLGAVFGSFMNMLIYRLPRGMSTLKPAHSICPKCSHRLEIPDLVPLLSWLALRGKCRHCRAPIGPRYFVIELVNGAIWAWLWWTYLIVERDPAKGIALALFGSALVVALATDLDSYVIPDEVNAFLLLVGFGYNVLFADPMTAVWGALTGWGILWGVAFLGRLAFGKDAMGHGDIKMARGIGAMLGPLLMVATFFIAVVVGLVGGLAQVFLRAKAESQEPEDDDAPYVPESLGSLLRCGLGYLLLIDIVALFAPRVGVAWFGAEAMAEEELDWTPQATAIPFGPYLAIGAVASAVFAIPLTKALNDYLRPPAEPTARLEQAVFAGGLKI